MNPLLILGAIFLLGKKKNGSTTNSTVANNPGTSTLNNPGTVKDDPMERL